MRSLRSVATADVYSDAVTLTGPKLARLDVLVTNAAVVAQYGRGWPGVEWLNEVDLLPNNYVLDRPGITGIRFRSRVAGVPAVVSVDAVQEF